MFVGLTLCGIDVVLQICVERIDCFVKWCVFASLLARDWPGYDAERRLVGFSPGNMWAVSEMIDHATEVIFIQVGVHKLGVIPLGAS
jgi:hypothetical protein